MKSSEIQDSIFSSKKAADWFEQIINHIKLDKIILETGVAHKEMAEFYGDAIAGNSDGVVMKVRAASSEYFIEKIVRAFIMELKNENSVPKRLAFGLSPSTILAWAEIKENDEKTEDAILLIEAKVNAYARDFGFSIETMIVEDSDGLSVPEHYVSVIQ